MVLRICVNHFVLCAVILFMCDIKWVDSSRKKPPYRAAKFENLSYGLTIVTVDKNGVVQVACCRHCGNLTSAEEVYDNCGPLPDCIKDVSGFGESWRLAIGSYCSTFKPTNYAYVHSSGPIGYGVSVDHLRGMAGILQFQEHVGDITTPYDRDAVVKAFHWLKINNPLYQQFLARLETLYTYFPITTLSGVGNPLPMKTRDVEIKSGPAEYVGQCEGMIIEADPLAGVVGAHIHDLTLLDNAGVQRHRVASDADLNQLCNSYKLSLRHPKIEEKLLPHLYPFGRGGFDKTLDGTNFVSSNKSVTHGQYVKLD